MRLVIDLDEKYKSLFYEAAKAAKATIIEDNSDFWIHLPEYVKTGIEKGLSQAKNGQVKSFEEVKKLLAER